ncbi:uncharacterized protein LAJ45_01530 [Morchella importuna]|uniref:DUF1715-domain-containing protein n=1 Tax=Morchella conica CCBAS932 TaxID=1392247 RepID=A0A3N4KGT7_9PEZI|nr:uncharacterized protein LAJ45_01530 [Morchella importuna]KAH8153763.1 hypothetical protein LAJ45_01530 [Morchella importuna]RPB09727.1 DUF1715-domain-containing protein [Morchella conica CCBAS932]
MADIFDSLLSLEEDFYQEGYALGVKDGEQAGRIEGRAFGLEKGFEKFLELGRLQGRCSVWKARIPPQSTAPPATVGYAGKPNDIHITNSRVQKQTESLAVILTNPPFKNDEESVEEVDETLKRGRNKAKVLSNMLGEKDESGSMKVVVDDESIEDAGRGARGVGKI